MLQDRGTGRRALVPSPDTKAGVTICLSSSWDYLQLVTFEHLLKSEDLRLAGKSLQEVDDMDWHYLQILFASLFSQAGGGWIVPHLVALVPHTDTHL